jgi:GntR family negative regulator for fad regulon and positive regulator of fabA
MEKLLRPAEHAEAQVLEAILNNEFPPGTFLPAERTLATNLGVTRPTLRETLQRLAARGWITISQGKPTRVNDYLDRGGLALLGSMVEYEKGLTPDMVENLLGVRLILVPGIARLAAAGDPQTLCDYLEIRPGMDDLSKKFACYDWGLHLLMVQLTNNPVFKFMFNDFEAIFQSLGKGYFLHESARQAALSFYREFLGILGENGGNGGSLGASEHSARVEQCVKDAMAASVDIWRKIRKEKY